VIMAVVIMAVVIMAVVVLIYCGVFPRPFSNTKHIPLENVYC